MNAKQFKISKSLIEKNEGDFVAAVQDANLDLSEHDELRWDEENITAEKIVNGRHVIVAEIIVK